MSVQQYRRKPQQPRNEEVFAARYESGQPLDDLLSVACMAGTEAEVTEVTFPSGRRILLAWHLDIPDDHPSKPRYVEVEPGDYLAYSRSNELLYDTDDDDLRHFYELAE